MSRPGRRAHRLNDIGRRPGQLPGNLSRDAFEDLVDIVRSSAERFGVATARRSRDRLLRRCREIESSSAIGHRRPDIPTRRPTLFLIEPQWVIAFNEKTAQVLRILHGARDLPTLFGE